MEDPRGTPSASPSPTMSPRQAWPSTKPCSDSRRPPAWRARKRLSRSRSPSRSPSRSTNYPREGFKSPPRPLPPQSALFAQDIQQRQRIIRGRSRRRSLDRSMPNDSPPLSRAPHDLDNTRSMDLEMSLDDCSVFVQNLPVEIDDYDQVVELFRPFQPIEICYAIDGWRVTLPSIASRDQAIMANASSSSPFSVTRWIPLSLQPQLLLPDDDDDPHRHHPQPDHAHPPPDPDPHRYRALIPDYCLNYVLEALLQTVAEQAWRDVVEAPVFNFLEEWAGRRPPAAVDSNVVVVEQAVPDVVVHKASSDVLVEKPPSNVVVDKASSDVVVDKASSDVVVDKASSDVVVDKASSDVVVEKPSSDVVVDDNASSYIVVLAKGAPSSGDSVVVNELVVNDKPAEIASSSSSLRMRRASSSSSSRSKVITVEPESASSPRCCSFCGATDDEDQLASCWMSGCHLALHIYCMAPPLRRLPRQWSCPAHVSSPTTTTATTSTTTPFDDDDHQQWRRRPSKTMKYIQYRE